MHWGCNHDSNCFINNPTKLQAIIKSVLLINLCVIKIFKTTVFLLSCNCPVWIIRPGKISVCRSVWGLHCVKVFSGRKISVSVTRDWGRARSSYDVTVSEYTVTPTGKWSYWPDLHFKMLFSLRRTLCIYSCCWKLPCAVLLKGSWGFWIIRVEQEECWAASCAEEGFLLVGHFVKPVCIIFN